MLVDLPSDRDCFDIPKFEESSTTNCACHWRVKFIVKKKVIVSYFDASSEESSFLLLYKTSNIILDVIIIFKV